MWIKRLLTRRGHGVHSPLAYGLITEALCRPAGTCHYADLEPHSTRASRQAYAVCAYFAPEAIRVCGCVPLPLLRLTASDFSGDGSARLRHLPRATVVIAGDPCIPRPDILAAEIMARADVLAPDQCLVVIALGRALLGNAARSLRRHPHALTIKGRGITVTVIGPGLERQLFRV